MSNLRNKRQKDGREKAIRILLRAGKKVSPTASNAGLCRKLFGRKFGKYQARSRLIKLADENEFLFTITKCPKQKKTASRSKRNGSFYSSSEWRKLRKKALKTYGKVCMACGVLEKGNKVHVDHIKPKSKYPLLALDFNNLQVLCATCNISKSNKNTNDYRSLTE